MRNLIAFIWFFIFIVLISDDVFKKNWNGLVMELLMALAIIAIFWATKENELEY